MPYPATREPGLFIQTGIDHGEVATVRIGGKVRIEKTELEDLIRRCRIPAGAIP